MWDLLLMEGAISASGTSPFTRTQKWEHNHSPFALSSLLREERKKEQSRDLRPREKKERGRKLSIRRGEPLKAAKGGNVDY